MMILKPKNAKEFWAEKHSTATERFARLQLSKGKLVYAMAFIGDTPKVVRLVSLEDMDQHPEAQYFYK